MKIDIKIEGLKELRAGLQGFSERRMNAAVATALTRTAAAVSRDWQAQINARIDSPTKRTQAATAFVGAKANLLQAMVLVKDRMPGLAPADYLAPQERGGGRLVKQFERALINSGAMPSGYITVPGRHAQLNAFGNVSKAQLIAVIRQLGQDYSPGYAQTISKSTSKRLASMAKHGRQYIVVQPGQERIAKTDAGIYERMADGHRKAIFLFKRAVYYKRRLDLLGDGVAGVQDAMRAELDRSVGDAIRVVAARGGA